MHHTKLGIIAGSGGLPEKLVRLCEEAQRPYFIIALEGHTEPSLLTDRPHGWMRLGAIGAGLHLLQENHVKEIVMAGAITRPGWSELRPDLEGLKWLKRLKFNAFGDDGILRGIINELEKDGYIVLGVDDLLPDVLTPLGALGKHEPTPEDWQDIRRARQVLDALSPVDVGQAVVVQKGLVLGIEAIEGTDALLQRCTHLRRPGTGGVLLKMSKINQERRVDLPTAGLRTIEEAVRAQLDGIALEAGHSLLLDQETTIAAADEAGLFIVGVGGE